MYTIPISPNGNISQDNQYMDSDTSYWSYSDFPSITYTYVYTILYHLS